MVEKTGHTWGEKTRHFIIFFFAIGMLMCFCCLNDLDVKTIFIFLDLKYTNSYRQYGIRSQSLAKVFLSNPNSPGGLDFRTFATGRVEHMDSRVDSNGIGPGR